MPGALPQPAHAAPAAACPGGPQAAARAHGGGRHARGARAREGDAAEARPRGRVLRRGDGLPPDPHGALFAPHRRRGRAGARRGRDRRARRAAARHRQDRHSRPDPAQAGQAGRGRVAGHAPPSPDTARDPPGQSLQVRADGGAERPGPPRKVRRHGLSERTGGGPHPAVRPHRRGGRRLRCAHLAATLQAGVAGGTCVPVPGGPARAPLRCAPGRCLHQPAQRDRGGPEPMAGPGSGGGGLVSGEPEAGAPPARANALQRLRARLAARPDTEHEQGILRLIISSLVFLYLLPDALTKHNTLPLYVMGIHLVLALAIFLRIAYSTNVSAAPLFLLYIWVTLGSGFRFGPRYLVSELAMSVGGFGIALYFNDFWRGHTALGVGLLLGMFAVSLYVLSLVRRMFDALARAEAANLAKRRFISMVSHELRTPLNAIIGMADLLRDTPLSREQADMLQTLRGSSRVMLGLVEDVLDFSKIEAGKVVMEKIDFDLHALVNSTCRIVSAQ